MDIKKNLIEGESPKESSGSNRTEKIVKEISKYYDDLFGETKTRNTQKNKKRIEEGKALKIT